MVRKIAPEYIHNKKLFQVKLNFLGNMFVANEIVNRFCYTVVMFN